MLQAVSVGTNDLERAVAFYDALLAILGIERQKHNETEAGYGTSEAGALFFVNVPFNRQAATVGNGVQISFAAKDRRSVDLFHQRALELGAQDEGAPGERAYSPGYYGAYCRDLDGNKLHVAFIPA